MARNLTELVGTEEQTLLGICPMSSEIVRATIREAASSSFIPMFIATPRQVDADRGYTGWSQRELRIFVEEAADELGYEGPYVLARDHGGPYQNTRDQGDPSVSTEQAMNYARDVFFADVEEDFDILHVDATEDATEDEILPIETVAERTVELIDDIETKRQEEGHDPVYYEVGTEEIAGGITEPESFERYIEILREKLDATGLENVDDQLLFIVGQVGTTMRVDMSNKFDPDRAENLVELAGSNDLFIKVHYTDWLDDETLAEFPELGIGAANVGPEFSAALVEGLADLDKRERELAEDDPNVTYSGLMETIEDAVIENGSWKKLAPEDFDREELDTFVEENRRQLALMHGRYVMSRDDVIDARNKMEQTINTKTDLNPEDYVIDTIQDSIHRYVEAFNLDGSSKRFQEGE